MDTQTKKLEEIKDTIENKLAPQIQATKVQYALSSKGNKDIKDDGIIQQQEGKLEVLNKVSENVHHNLATIDAMKKQLNGSNDEYTVHLKNKKTLADLFSHSKAAKKNAVQLQGSGLPEIAELEFKKKPKKKSFWKKLLMMAAGIFQIAVGYALTTISCGAWGTVGLNLMMAGIDDVFTSLKSMINDEDIDWKKWGGKKVMQIATTGLAIGMSKVAQNIDKYAAMKNNKYIKGAFIHLKNKVSGEMGEQLVKGSLNNIDIDMAKEFDDKMKAYTGAMANNVSRSIYFMLTFHVERSLSKSE